MMDNLFLCPDFGGPGRPLQQLQPVYSLPQPLSLPRSGQLRWNSTTGSLQTSYRFPQRAISGSMVVSGVYAPLHYSPHKPEGTSPRLPSSVLPCVLYHSWAKHGFGGFPKSGALFRSPHNTEYSILGSILRPLIFGNSRFFPTTTAPGRQCLLAQSAFKTHGPHTCICVPRPPNVPLLRAYWLVFRVS